MRSLMFVLFVALFSAGCPRQGPGPSQEPLPEDCLYEWDGTPGPNCD